MTLPRSIIAAGCAALLLPLLLATKLSTALLEASADLGATLAESVPLSWQARAAAEAEANAAAEANAHAEVESLEINAQDRQHAPGARPATQLASSHELHAELSGASARSLHLNLSSARSPAAVQGTRVDSIPRGIRVRKGRVLALSRSAGIPGASPVPASGARPAGLRLAGVGGWGVGVQDGDVLTHAAGQPLHSLAQVIGLVAGARHQHAGEISGTLYRGDERINLIVEMPYLKQRELAQR